MLLVTAVHAEAALELCRHVNYHSETSILMLLLLVRPPDRLRHWSARSLSLFMRLVDCVLSLSAANVRVVAVE
jgi:hypothetical protein